MSNWLTLTLGLLLFVGGDVPGAARLRPSSKSTEAIPTGDIVLFPEATETPNSEVSPTPTAVSLDDDQAKQTASQSHAKPGVLSESGKLDLIRYVSGEFAKATKPLPGGKEGFLVFVGKPIAYDQLDRAVATHGAAVHGGDSVQITKLVFRDHAIQVDLNGGGKGKWRLQDHLEVGMAGPMPTATTTTTTQQEDQGPPGIQPGRGSTIFLEFVKNIPNLTPDDLKKLLTPLLDFSKQRSASVHWVDTLSPELKKAIQDRRPVVGMDRDEVISAIGKPDRKVRERDSNGNDTEDWIYGQPPSKTIFVHFVGDKVTSVKQYPQ